MVIKKVKIKFYGILNDDGFQGNPKTLTVPNTYKKD